MKKWSYFLQNFMIMPLGGAIYYCIELMYRGYSHCSMFFLGACCFGLIDVITQKATFLKSVWSKMAVCAVGITVLEWICGCIVNLWLKLDVWDYSDMPLQIKGQVCIVFSFFWFLLSFPAMQFCKSIRILLFE